MMDDFPFIQVFLNFFQPLCLICGPLSWKYHISTRRKAQFLGFPGGKVGAPFPSQHFGKMIQRQKGAQSVWETKKP